MKLSKLLNTTLKKTIAIVVVLLLIGGAVVFAANPSLFFGVLKPLLWSLLIVAIAWVGIHFGLKAHRKRKRNQFDEGVAAKEGIEDRKREWDAWTDELEKQGIDRYELPFYLLVGEPQSGKSVLLHNSDLHFPFGQNRLSGVGGTRGCDWWFTEEAVILDMAGRLFTHEGGAADRLEFEAFLKLLADFRPLCPANGVILVIPCDSLLQDTEEECSSKANKIQHALLTLTTSLQAQLPVYVVLTKGDQVFGFAESVHRLDVEQRHQMFGWSRPADRIDAPFDVVEVLDGYDSMVKRAQLLRAHMMAGARLPEATPEIDRMLAFPHELEGLKSNLEAYLKRIFTSSNITDRLFFRGIYLTSGLQSGVPIARVSSDLFGAPGEADMRDLEALFQKQRAYFIKDLIRNRVFGERGLVRPTEGRVAQTRRSATIGYGVAGLILIISLVTSAFYLARETDTSAYELALDESARAVAQEPPRDTTEHMRDLLYRLQCIGDAARLDTGRMEQTFSGPSESFKELYCAVFDTELIPLLTGMVLDEINGNFVSGIEDFDELDRSCKALKAIMRSPDYSSSSVQEAVVEVLPYLASTRVTTPGQEPLTLQVSFEWREAFGPDAGLLYPLDGVDAAKVTELAIRAAEEVEGCLRPESRLRPDNELGYMLAWKSLRDTREELEARDSIEAIAAAHFFAASVADMKRIRDLIGRKLSLGKCILQMKALGSTYRNAFVEFLDEEGVPHNFRDAGDWIELTDLMNFTQTTIDNYGPAEPSPFSFSSLGLHFGADDAGRTLFTLSEDVVANAQEFVELEEDGFATEYEPDEPAGMVKLCEAALPLGEEPGNLRGLGENLERIHEVILANTSRGVLLDIFKAECSEFSQLFRQRIVDTASAREAFLDPEEPPTSPLPQSLVDELVNLHMAIGQILKERTSWGGIDEDRMTDWQVVVERTLNELLAQAGHPEAWMPELGALGEFTPETWRYLESLGRVGELVQRNPGTYKIKDKATGLQRDGFLHLADQLLDRWSKRDADSLDETKDTIDELNRLAQGAQQLEGDAFSGTDFRTWQGRVDALLKKRLDTLEARVQRVWHANFNTGGSLRVVVDDARDELGTINDKINKSEDMSALSDILSNLRQNGDVRTWLELESSEVVLAGLEGWDLPRNADEVEIHSEYTRLVNALADLEGKTDDPERVTEQFRRNWMEWEEEPADTVNAGVRLVRDVRRLMKERLQQQIREDYLAGLEDLFTGDPYEDLLEVFRWEPEMEVTDAMQDNARMESALHTLFREGKRGDFWKLKNQFHLIGDDSIDSEVFALPQEEEDDPLAQFHHFLNDLQAFLLSGSDSDPGKRTVRGAEINFVLEPEYEEGSLWNVANVDMKDRPAWFFYPGDNSSKIMNSMGIHDLGEARIEGWSFSKGKDAPRFRLMWAQPLDYSSALAHPSRLVFDAPTSLGPLLLAWSGDVVDEDDRIEFKVEVQPKGTTLQAELRIRFENPIPLRPEEDF